MKKNITPGIKDEEFIRGDVPMTKEEVREISICKMKLSENSILYDIGSGTGSISVEASLLSESIKVFAIEINPDALRLINENKMKFNAEGIKIIEGIAPDCLSELPVPTHAFIGGTKGNLIGILNVLHEKNPSMRIVMNAVCLESISEMTDAIKKFKIKNEDVVEISISRASKIGHYHLMKSLNPVFIFSFDFAGDD